MTRFSIHCRNRSIDMVELIVLVVGVAVGWVGFKYVLMKGLMDKWR